MTTNTRRNVSNELIRLANSTNGTYTTASTEQLREAAKRIKHLYARRNAWRTDAKGLKRKLDAAVAEKTTLLRNIQSLTNELGSLRQTASSRYGEIGTLQAEVTRLRNDNVVLRNTVRDLQASYPAPAPVRTEVEVERLNDLLSQIDDLRQEVVALRDGTAD
jgi:chromosome segregation ATPase